MAGSWKPHCSVVFKVLQKILSNISYSLVNVKQLTMNCLIPFILLSVAAIYADADSRCIAMGGTCKDWKANTCDAGWKKGLCLGDKYRRCCLRCDSTCNSNENWWDINRDSKCKRASGVCKHNSNRCEGTYQGGKCGGPSERQCCVPTSTGGCPLVVYPQTSHIRGYNGQAIRVHPDFVGSMNKIKSAAVWCDVKVWVTHSFRKQGQPLSGAIVIPASRSNHLVGHAIDMNVQSAHGWCNSKCLQAKSDKGAECFINRIIADGLRWGGNFNRKDPVHIDDYYNRYIGQYDSVFQSVQNQCN
ncbi:uncharacterized protein LOC143458016 isoform X1 [Clavelina lepadiformis]|uniref:uncharacterized protein LOC143458016 isoform X1 n=2 Tax=Clavelina lepadiformis TaxID=159417 RepID=UPI0040412277